MEFGGGHRRAVVIATAIVVGHPSVEPGGRPAGNNEPAERRNKRTERPAVVRSYNPVRISPLIIVARDDGRRRGIAISSAAAAAAGKRRVLRIQGASGGMPVF